MVEGRGRGGFIQTGSPDTGGLEGIYGNKDRTVRELWDEWIERKTKAKISKSTLDRYRKAFEYMNDFVQIQTGPDGLYPERINILDVKLGDLINPQVISSIADHVRKSNVPPLNHLNWGPNTLQVFVNENLDYDTRGGVNLFADGVKQVLGPAEYEELTGKARSMQTKEIRHFPMSTANKIKETITHLEDIEKALVNNDLEKLQEVVQITIEDKTKNFVDIRTAKARAKALVTIQETKDLLTLQLLGGFRPSDLARMTVGQIEDAINRVIDPKADFKMIRYLSKGKNPVTKKTDVVPRTRPLLPEIEAILRRRLASVGTTDKNATIFSRLAPDGETVKTDKLNLLLRHHFGDEFLEELKPESITRNNPLGTFEPARFTAYSLRHYMESRLHDTGAPLEHVEQPEPL